MSRSRRDKQQGKQFREEPKTNVGRHFRIFIKPVGEDGFVDESLCGWLSFDENSLPKIIFENSLAATFQEREEGHGSYADWKRLIEEENPGWRVSDLPHYVD